MKNHRRLTALFSVLTALGLLYAAAVSAQDSFPSKPMRIIVPFVPGGASDMLARLVGQKMGESFGQPVIVENRPGAGGNIGADAGAKAAPNGYTLTLAAAGFMAVNPSIYANLPYDSVKDFAPVSLLVKAPLLFVVNPKVQATSVGDFIKLAKGSPGKLTIGNGGTGTAQHLGGEYFTNSAAITVTHVPYKGSAPATTDLLGGVVDAQFDNMVTLIPHVKAGKLRALAVSSAKRSALLPDVPTIAEAALPGFETGTWYGIVAPAGTPKTVLERLNHELHRILALPEVQDKLNAQGLEPAGNTQAEFAAMIRADIAKYSKIVKAAGVKVD